VVGSLGHPVESPMNGWKYISCRLWCCCDDDHDGGGLSASEPEPAFSSVVSLG
jgi:hypothetical protein